MKRMLLVFAVFLTAFTVNAQDSISIKKDSLSFIKSKRMSDADLAKKKEGTFITVFLIYLLTLLRVLALG